MEEMGCPVPRGGTRNILAFVVALACLALLGGRASAVSFNSFDQVTVTSGAIFTVTNNGQNVTYRLGFASSADPIVVTFSGADQNFHIGPGGGTDKITAIESFYLLSSNSTLTGNRVSADITNYKGTSAGTWGPANGTSFLSDSAENFGSANYLRMSSDPNWKGNGTDARYGDFSFSNIHFTSGTGPIYVGVHARDINGNTGFLILTLAVVPEPGSLAVALSGLVPVGLVGVCRLRRRSALVA
jgi:hypothetical protein